MIEKLQQLDRWLLLAANTHHTAALDEWMIFFSERLVWFPAYFVLIVVLMYQYQRRAWLLLPLLGLSVALADAVSSRFFKPFFARLRPCHDPALSATLNLAHGCGGQFGFLSSHAANAFAMTVFLGLILPPRYRAAKILLVVWAALIAYSRMYLGAHYPSDVVGGTLLGSLFGWLCALAYRRGAAHWWPQQPAV